MWDIRLFPPRRRQARIPVERLCSELVDDSEQHALVVDLAEDGLRLQRPLSGALPNQLIQLELDLPGYDDLIWASGRVCFDQLWRMSGGPAGRARLLRTSGVRLVAVAQRHLRVLREYVHETRRLLENAGALPDRRGDGRTLRGSPGNLSWAGRTTAFLRG